MRKAKIINDPIYGFIRIEQELILQILEHRFFQRLRRIQQLSMASYVYPGACHTRFNHSLGAYHLATVALQTLKNKNIKISSEEFIATQLAALLHDIGHSPFSHTLESHLIKGVKHEKITIRLMEILNKEFNGQLSLAIDIFTKRYKRNFFHQLISSHLDVDRLDYLTRDSFFTGVKEGQVAYDRIINILNVHEDELVLEEKGAYSIEDFLIARRIMYWQVYYHKTIVGLENLLLNIFKRVSILQKVSFNNKHLNFFFNTTFNINQDGEWISHFASIDDTDVVGLIKELTQHDDKIIQQLARAFLSRKTFKTFIQEGNSQKIETKKILTTIQKNLKLNNKELIYFHFTQSLQVDVYNNEKEKIKILSKENKIIDLKELKYLLINQMIQRPQHKQYQGFWRT